MSKLQEFLNLGDYYASNGGILKRKVMPIWMILKRMQDTTITPNSQEM